MTIEIPRNMTSPELSIYGLEIKPFGADRFIPMAFPSDVTLQDIEQAAETYVSTGQAMWVRILRRDSIVLIKQFGWVRS